MKTLSEIQAAVDATLRTVWDRRTSETVPVDDDLGLGNDGIELDATVLYADLVDSTGLVQSHKDWFAAEMYKSYLLAASEVIRNNGGSVTAFDGDRVMAVFVGKSKNSSAAKSALQINYVVDKAINPSIRKHYSSTSFVLRHAIGIDTSTLLVARTGVRGANDLVWVGRAANYAAKLCTLRDGSYSTMITEAVYQKLNPESKLGGSPARDMWTKFSWVEFGTVAYRSNWHWRPP